MAETAAGSWDVVVLGRRPDRGPLAVRMYRVRGDRPGPTVLITAGIHGDEFGSVVLAHDLIRWLSETPVAGEVRVVPALNVPALTARSRRMPEAYGGLDLNACFPGSEGNTPAHRLAAGAWEAFAADADLVLDLHTSSGGSASMLVWYLCAGSPLAARERALAGASSVRLALTAPLHGSLVEAAGRAGKPGLILETGEGGRVDEPAVAGGRAAVQAVLAALWGRQPAREPVVPLAGYGPVPAPAGGLWRAAVGRGDRVECGRLLGTVWPFAGPPCEVIAPRAGLVIGTRTDPVVESGGRVALLGWE